VGRQRLYVLETNSAFQVALRDPEWDDILGPYKLWRAETLPTKPVIFEHDLGREPMDLIRTGHGDMLFLLADRVIELLRKGAVTGWTTYAVEVYGKRGVQIPGYQGFAVTGRCGGAVDTKTQEDGKPVYYLDPNTWDGSDIFLMGDERDCYVTARARDLLKTAEVRNIRWKPVWERVTLYTLAPEATP
jgi:hypothetical protein